MLSGNAIRTIKTGCRGCASVAYVSVDSTRVAIVSKYIQKLSVYNVFPVASFAAGSKIPDF